MEYFIVFRSTNHAIKAEQCLLAAKINVAVAPLPSQIREGCGICLRARPDTIRQALQCLEESGIDGIRLFSSGAGGSRNTYRNTNQNTYNISGDTGGFVELAPGAQDGLGNLRKFSLLDSCASGGCGAKISPGELSTLLAGLPVFTDKNLLVGFEAYDDAAVYKLNEAQSLVMTADFFPPMVDDPATFGRIAAANALSDIYTMGAKPLMALNLVCFPQSMDMGILREIMVGGAEKVAEASAVLCGGHSIYDKEPKYGLAVTGVVDNGKILRNNTPELGHKLILTKPLGTGLIMAALRGGIADAGDDDDAGAGADADADAGGGGYVGGDAGGDVGGVAAAVRSMERLNRYAAEKASGYRVSACTDITGFGFLGHTIEMVADRASMVIYKDEVPYFEEAYRYAGEYLMTAAGQRNRNHLSSKVDVSGLPFALQELLFDPQTSGGLLLCVAPEHAGDLLAAIKDGDPAATIIGEAISREGNAVIFD